MKTIQLLSCLMLSVLLMACETPKSPNFQTTHELEIPLTKDKTYRFLGNEEALIDTTSEDFVDLFSTDPNSGLVTLSKTGDINFGNLNNAIPEVNVPSIGIVNLTVPPATGSQKITANGSSSIDNSGFEFRDPNHFVEMDGGALTIDVSNSTDVSIDLEISFPEVQDPNESSFLVISIQNISPNESISNSYDLANHRIYAGIDNEIDYEVTVTTNSSTQQGGDIITEIGFENLGISRAQGYIVPKNVLLTQDITNDGRENLDVFNDEEASITSIDGMSNISDKVNELTFANPSLNMLYQINLGVNTTVYAAIAGTDSKGNTVFLTGNDGTDFDVAPSEMPDGLEANGQPLSSDQVIKFSIETASNPDPQQGEMGNNLFDADRTNISEFFSNLPTEIRFVGIAAVNESQDPGEIVNPVIFDPSLSLDVPVYFSAQNATFEDTLEADLSDLPGAAGDKEIPKATLTINYINGLPLSMDFSVNLVDKNGTVVATAGGSNEPIKVSSATTNQQGFVGENGATEDRVQVRFTGSEARNLYKTRDIRIEIELNTPENKAIKIRADDSISFNIKVQAGITSTVN